MDWQDRLLLNGQSSATCRGMSTVWVLQCGSTSSNAFSNTHDTRWDSWDQIGKRMQIVLCYFLCSCTWLCFASRHQGGTLHVSGLEIRQCFRLTGLKCESFIAKSYRQCGNSVGVGHCSFCMASSRCWKNRGTNSVLLECQP